MLHKPYITRGVYKIKPTFLTAANLCLHVFVFSFYVQNRRQSVFV